MQMRLSQMIYRLMTSERMKGSKMTKLVQNVKDKRTINML